MLLIRGLRFLRLYFSCAIRSASLVVEFEVVELVVVFSRSTGLLFSRFCRSRSLFRSLVNALCRSASQLASGGPRDARGGWALHYQRGTGATGAVWAL